jgi:hypothetical protein
MADLPIPFSPPMIRAIGDDRKTMTRRLLSPQPPIDAVSASRILCSRDNCHDEGKWQFWKEGPMRPTGEPIKLRHARGDRLYVKEAWRAPASLDHLSGKAIGESAVDAGHRRPWAPLKYEADGALNSARDWRDWAPADATPGRYRHARFMPRWASRLTLIVESVKVERLQEISEADALAESCFKGKATGRIYESMASMRLGGGEWACARDWYADLWERLHGKDAWRANPWVAAVTFRTIRANIDTLDAQGRTLVCEEVTP